MDRKRAVRLAKLLMLVGSMLMAIGLVSTALTSPASAAPSVSQAAPAKPQTVVKTVSAAELPEGCLTEGSASETEVVLESCSYSEDSSTINVSSVERASASGKIQLTYFNPGAKSWSLAKAKRCKLIYVSIKWSGKKIRSVVNASKRKVNGTWCVRLKHGSTWANSGKEGKRHVPFTATVRGSWSLMTLKYPRKGVWVHQGEFKNGRFVQVCENWWKIGLKPPLTDRDVIMLRSEAEVQYQIKFTTISRGLVSVGGSLRCPAGTLYGSASAEAMGSANGSIFVKARSVAEAEIRGAQRAQAEVSVLAAARIKAQFGSEATAHVRITLKCSDNPPPHDECPDIPGSQPPGYPCEPSTPTGDVLCKNPPHLYAPGGNGIMVCELSRSDNVKPTLSQFSVEALNDYAYFSQPTEFGWREAAQINPCPANVLCVRVQVWAVSPGLFKYRAEFAQYDQVNGQFLIEEDDF